ncbi:hypothetical protein SAY86_007661 [Trapa natans]|uniref:Uncharacterized protein n=1 Tax=Trapa natans TaxID=22666 RepID=A0AAN7QY35_TRANT|nr:hypothetical protein SAY86_007661 [Trapa natans]
MDIMLMLHLTKGGSRGLFGSGNPSGCTVGARDSARREAVKDDRAGTRRGRPVAFSIDFAADNFREAATSAADQSTPPWATPMLPTAKSQNPTPPPPEKAQERRCPKLGGKMRV